MRKLEITLVMFAFVALTAGTAFADGGADTYKAKCAMCHGADGSGNTAMGKKLELKDLKTSKLTEAQMIELVTKGKGKMPANAGKLTDAQIKDVVSYVRSLQKK